VSFPGSKRITGGILRAAGRVLARLGTTLAVLLSIAVLAAAVALPLWYFSSRSQRGYSIFVLTVMAGLLLFLLARRIILQSRLEGSFRGYAARRLLPRMRTAGLVVGTLLAAYGAAWLAGRARALPAAALAAGWLALLGYLRYGRRRKS
jgi:hypothetical protein